MRNPYFYFFHVLVTNGLNYILGENAKGVITIELTNSEIDKMPCNTIAVYVNKRL